MSSSDPRVPKHILILAYALSPYEGSEPGVGWSWAISSARQFRTTVITRASTPTDIELPRNLTIVRVGQCLQRIERWRHVHYLIWLAIALVVGKRLTRESDVDVSHHVTYANDWLPSPVAFFGTPYIWGPIAGTSTLPWGLARRLPIRFLIFELMRNILTRALRRFVAKPLMGPHGIVLAANEDVYRSFARKRHTLLRPNIVLPSHELSDALALGSGVRHERRAVFVGRLLRLKGVDLAIQALADPRLKDWTLHILGDGESRADFEVLALHMGISERIHFHGRVERSAVLAELATASVMIFPSLREGSPWAVGEAISLGCPVVSLDLGGASHLVKSLGGGIVVAPHGDVPGAIASAVLQIRSIAARPALFACDAQDEFAMRAYRAAAFVGAGSQ